MKMLISNQTTNTPSAEAARKPVRNNNQTEAKHPWCATRLVKGLHETKQRLAPPALICAQSLHENAANGDVGHERNCRSTRLIELLDRVLGFDQADCRRDTILTQLRDRVLGLD